MNINVLCGFIYLDFKISNLLLRMELKTQDFMTFSHQPSAFNSLFNSYCYFLFNSILFFGFQLLTSNYFL